MTPPSSYIDMNREGPATWLGNGLWMHLPTYYVTHDEGYRIDVRIDRVGDSIGVAEVTVTAKDGKPVNSTTLRQLRFTDVAAQAAFSAIHWVEDYGEGARFAMNPMTLVLDVLRIAVHKFRSANDGKRIPLPQGAYFRALQAVCRASSLVGENAQKMLMDNVGISRATANYWVAQAKAAQS